jgi:hypothetical protein
MCASPNIRRKCGGGKLKLLEFCNRGNYCPLRFFGTEVPLFQRGDFAFGLRDRIIDTGPHPAMLLFRHGGRNSTCTMAEVEKTRPVQKSHKFHLAAQSA